MPASPWRTLLLAAALLLAACGPRVSAESYARIQDGMSEAEVLDLLGKPAESSGISVLGVSGTSSKWVGEDAVITVQFVNGKVRFKSLGRPER